MWVLFDVLGIILKKFVFNRVSYPIPGPLLYVLDIEPSCCNDAFRYFSLHFSSDKLQEDMQAKKVIY